MRIFHFSFNLESLKIVALSVAAVPPPHILFTIERLKIIIFEITTNPQALGHPSDQDERSNKIHLRVYSTTAPSPSYNFTKGKTTNTYKIQTFSLTSLRRNYNYYSHLQILKHTLVKIREKKRITIRKKRNFHEWKNLWKLIRIQISRATTPIFVSRRNLQEFSKQ